MKSKNFNTKNKYQIMVTYNTKEECKKAIDTLKVMGIEPPQWMTDQLASLSVCDTFKGIYPHLCQKLGYSDELQNCVKQTVDKLLNPVNGEKAKDPGLLLGKIQSGKTRAFVGVISLLFDKGFDIAIVLTKGTKALAEQTIARMEKDFCDFLNKDVIGRPVIEVSDILNIRDGVSKRELNDKNIIVCKKEKNNMNILNEISKKNGFADKKIVIIDDEADFASRNYKIKNGNIDVAVIADQIDSFVDSMNDCYYLQVTATPYSLYLQPDGCIELSNGGVAMPFKPRYTTLLPIYAEYVGGREYFELSQNPKSMYSMLHHLVREECREAITRIDRRYINNVDASSRLQELRDAILGYFVATSIRRIQERKQKVNYLSSCVIHVEIAKAKQTYEAELVNTLLEQWVTLVKNSNGDMPDAMRPQFEEQYGSYYMSYELGKDEGLVEPNIFPGMAEVWVELASIILNDDYKVRLVNSDNDVKALLNREGQLKLTHTANIFVGGQILDRGITISNLICFFYGRNPLRLQQDTVLQHSRMYGNRSKLDMSVTRFYTTQRLFINLKQIHELDEQLREWLIAYSKDPLCDPSMAVVFRGDKNVVPCAPGKIAPSDCIALSPGKRMLPVGFQTGSKTAIEKTVKYIDQLLSISPNYKNKDQDGFFELDITTAERILHLIRETYIYDRPIDNNCGLGWDENEFVTALRYATTNSCGKLWCLHRTNRNISRLRKDGSGFIDAPEDGRTDLTPAKAKAIDQPVLMLFKENGKATNGWRDAEFYWPVFVAQQKLKAVSFTAVKPKEI